MKVALQPKVAIVHDDLVQWGGAERVLAGLSETFPDAPIYTSLFDEENLILKKYFVSKTIITSPLQKIPGWKNLYKMLLPLYPIAFEQFVFDEFDVVISHSTRFAKSVITKPHTKHICYCPTPPRFLWNFSSINTSNFLQPYFSLLRIYDRVSAARVDLWIANSKNVQGRINKVYRSPAAVIYPFVDFEQLSKFRTFNGGYLLMICRLNDYKRVDIAIATANKMYRPLKIVGVGPCGDYLRRLAGPTVDFLGMVPEDLLYEVIAGCKALVITGEEDFGLTSIEAQALGKPVVAYQAGGAIETVIEGKTGYFFGAPTAESLTSALTKLEKYGYNQKECKVQASHFSKGRFQQQFKSLVMRSCKL